jgi:hypothetical protein
VSRWCGDGCVVGFVAGIGGGVWEGRLVPFDFAQGCGCAPAFGSKVRALRGWVIGTAEAMPYRFVGGLGDERERFARTARMPTLSTMKPSRRWVTRFSKHFQSNGTCS